MNINTDILNKILASRIQQYIKSHTLYPSELYFPRIMQDWINIQKWINITIILMCWGRKKSHDHINWYWKSIWQNLTFIYDFKKTQQTSNRGNFPNFIKNIHRILQLIVYLMVKKWMLNFYINTINISTVTIQFNTMLEFLASSMRQENKIKGTLIRRKKWNYIPICKWHRNL